MQLRAWPEATVKLSGEGSKVLWTDVWGMSSEKAYLAMDGATAEKGGKLTLIFQNLPVGNYQCRLYLHNIGIEKNTPEAEIQVSLGNDEVRAEGIRPTTGKYLDQKQPTSTTVGFSIDEGNPVSLTIEEVSGTQSLVLNGLELKELPQ